MRINIDQAWITAAKDALRSTHIVQRVNDELVYPKEFKGYISSFAATIVQSGMLPALAIYESTDSDAAAARHLLPMAITKVLITMGELSGQDNALLLLSDYWVNTPLVDRDSLRDNIQTALVALKLAIRMFCPGNVTITNPLVTTSQNDTDATENYTPPQGRRTNYYANVGWLFYRDYYSNYEQDRNIQVGNNRKTINKFEAVLDYEKNPFLLSSQLKEMLAANRTISETLTSAGFSSFSLSTLYPGLVIGLGLSHGTPSKNDLKCGFQFDYTTGLPVIPGSSVKGVLRSVFPKGNYSTDTQADDKDAKRREYIASLLEAQGIFPCKPQEIDQLRDEIFNNNDVFMDAIITGPAQGKFLGNDFITPHKGYSNPIPIRFLKVLPGIEFTFFFKLSNTTCLVAGKQVDKKRLKRLFQDILLDVGIGGKTNVGYGHLALKKSKHYGSGKPLL